MISSQTAAAAGNEFLPLRRALLGKAGAKTGDAPSKQDLLAALGQSSEGDTAGATEKASRALSKLDDASDPQAAQGFASAVAPFLRGRQSGAETGHFQDGSANGGSLSSTSAAGGVATQWDEDGDGQVSATEWNRHNQLAGGGNTTSTDLSAGRLNSQMLTVLLQHQAA